MASQRADIGRYEARRGVPRPPPQPTGTMGPPGPCPVPLAPWGDAQAPEPRPIQQAARSAVSLVWPCVGDLHPPTHLGWEWEVPTTPGATRGHWGGVGRVSRRRGASMAKKSLQWVVLGQNPSVVAMEAGHARCLMRKPSAVFDSSTAQAIKEHGAIRFNLDVEASRGSTRKVPMSVPSLHCPIPQLSTTQKQRCVCASAICVHLSRLDMYQVWCYMLDPYMRAFDLTLEQSADLREQLVLWSSPDASTRRQLRAELNQFLTGTGDFGAALSSIKQEILEAAENTMVFYNNRDPNCKPTYKEITFILGLHEDNGHCSGCFPMHARCSVCSTSSIPACYKRDTTQTRHDAQAILRLFSPGGGLISARRSCTNMRPSRC